jgi:hypothetical protein
MILLCYNIAIVGVGVVRKSLIPLHDFVIMPAVYTCLVHVLIYEPWYLAMICWAFAWKVDTYRIPCPIYEWHKSLVSLEIRLNLKKRQYIRGF